MVAKKAERRTPPIIFISYSHDSKEHQERVLGISERLRSDGYETRLDRYVRGAPTEGWSRWMLNQLDEAEFVLLVCTNTYYRRFRGHEKPGVGQGSDWEGQLITIDLYKKHSRTLKFVPVMFEQADSEFVPDPLGDKTRYTLDSDDGYDDLCAFLDGAAGVEPGEVGEWKPKTRRKAQPMTFDERAESSSTSSSLSSLRSQLSSAEIFNVLWHPEWVGDKCIDPGPPHCPACDIEYVCADYMPWGPDGKPDANAPTEFGMECTKCMDRRFPTTEPGSKWPIAKEFRIRSLGHLREEARKRLDQMAREILNRKETFHATETLILECFEQFNADTLLIQSIRHCSESWTPPRRRQFDGALTSLESQGVIQVEYRDGSVVRVKLTDTGQDRVFGSSAD